MKSPWTTYAVILDGKPVEAPGSKKTIAEVDLLAATGRVITRPFRDGNLQVLRYQQVVE